MCSFGRLVTHRVFLQLWGWGFRSICWEVVGDGTTGTLMLGREAGLLIPLVLVKAVRGGESLPVWGFKGHQKGSMAAAASPGLRDRGSSDSPASSMPATWGAPCKRVCAASGSAVMAHRATALPLGGPVPDKEGLHRAAMALPSGGPVPGSVQDIFPSPGGQGRGTGPDGVRRWRLSLVPRACARAVGMGWGVESSGGPGGLPWVFGSSLRLVYRV